MKPLELLPIPLLGWYRENARVLPWRSDPAPYHVLVSEIMLQQTRVAAVLGYYARFMEALPTIADLAAADEARLMKLWQGLGYYNRARNLKKAAVCIMEDFQGVFPCQYADILSLPGVGEYTAGAVASIAFGVPVPAVDGNVLRVVARITGDGGDIWKPAVRRRMGEAVRDVMPLACPGDFNQALMELGATVCLPNGAPLCGSCPAAEFCTARREARTGELPVKPPKKARRVEERTVFLLFYRDRVALRRRPDRGLLAGLWEYPNEPGGGLELLEQWGVEPRAVTPAGGGRHIFTHIEWHMRALAVEAEGPALPGGWVWAGTEALGEIYAVPNAFQAFQPAVEARLRGREPGRQEDKL